MTTRKSSAKSETAPKEDKVETPVEETPVVETPAEPQSKPTDPVKLEVQVDNETNTLAPAADPEKLQTDFREKLSRRTDDESMFVPSNPVSLEKAAKAVAVENGFDLTRGTSVGARLIARSQKKV